MKNLADFSFFVTVFGTPLDLFFSRGPLLLVPFAVMRIKCMYNALIFEYMHISDRAC